MGSEHYCLRWNNHQSNLLGVFSQLLQDESLVDVTLACSEGAPIRAHKVVLSACSSYFQSLFLDHPEKHPIVILKDVRFAELQTLVEFMYKGEVNVQYCQLSALLKTAESLKVKGLAEMTNQNTTLREPEREPERLRPHSQPCKRSNSCDSPVDATLSGPSTSAATLAASISSTQHAAALAASALATATLGSSAASSTSANTSNATTCTIASSATSLTSAAYSSGSSLISSKREHPSERCSPSPPKRLHGKHEQNTPQPLDLYQRRLEHQQQEDTKENSIVNNNSNEKHRSSTPQAASGTIQKHSNSSDGGGSTSGVSGEGIKKREDIEKDSIRNFNSPDRLTRHDVVCRRTDDLLGVEGITGGIEKNDDVEDVEYGDEEMELDDDGDNNSEDVCLNMKIHSSSLAAALVSPQLAAQRGLESSGHGVGGIGGMEGGVDSARSTPLTTTIPLAFDTHSQRPASRSSREGSGMDRPSSRGGLGGLPSTSASALAGGLSPASSTAAVLGLHSDTVPGSSGLGPVQSVPLSLKKEIDCSEDDNSNSRHHLQPRSASASGVLGGELDYRTPHESLMRNFGMATRCPTPFAFPFSPLGLSLFDIDPSRILTMLHHQTWLAEEALRNRGLLTLPPNSKDLSQRYNPLSDLLSKDYHVNHMHLNTADLLARSSLTSGVSAASSAPHLGPTDLVNKQQPTQQHRSITQQQQYKQQQPQPPFNIRYPSPAAFFHQQHQQQMQQQLQTQTQKLTKSTRQSTPSPQQTAITNQSLMSGSSLTEISSIHKCSEGPVTPCHKDDDNDGVIELTTTHDEAAAIRDRDSGNSSAATTSSITSSMLYKDSLEQLLQRRHSGGILTGEMNLKSYSQLLLNSTTPTDTSSCKEKSSSSSTSSTPPPTPGTPGQPSLSRNSLLKSPSETSSLFSEAIEEETRCIVCNAQFPNVWLLEQHAALQHPLLGPAYAKHKETNHRARLPADKLFTCDVCGMQFRYLKSFKKHRLNHALERLHGKKGKNPFAAHMQQIQEQEMVTSSQEPNIMMADTETVEDLRINIKKEQDEEEHQQQMQQQQQQHDENQDATVDSASIMNYQENQTAMNKSFHTNNGNESTISSSDGIHSTKKSRLLQASLQTHVEAGSSYHSNHQQQHPTPTQHHSHTLVHHPHLTPQLSGHLAHNMSAMAAAAAAATTPQHQQQMTPQTAQQAAVAAATAAANSMNSLNSLNSITSLINADRLPNDQFLGLNPQEASILNFLRVDAQERQRDKRPPASRFACPFCGKCVRSKENLKLHVRKHTGERPFVCLFCGRAFGGKSDLTRHLRIHTGERPYHCESCGKCFARADYLSKHLTTHIHNAPR